MLFRSWKTQPSQNDLQTPPNPKDQEEEMTPKQLKQRKCRGCAKEFMPTKPLQVVCSWECAKDVAENKRDRKEKKELREAIKGLKSRNDYKAEAQQEFNKFIRLRDAALPCVSCGRTEDQIENTYGGKWDCGHYLSRGSHPELALDRKSVV